MTRPSVTVVITAYNHAAYIEQAIQSSFKQTDGNYGLEVIVVNDSSTDDTLKVIKRLQKKYKFKLLSTEKNSGPSVARNLGIQAADSKYISFLDGDDYLLPNKVVAQLGALEPNPNVAVCYTDCLVLRDGQMEKKPLSRLWPPAQGQIYTHLLLRNCIASHAVLMKTSVAKRYLFDESLRGPEDYDCWLRIAHDQHDFLYIDKPLVVYRRGPRSLSSPSQKIFDSILRVLDKNQDLVRTPQQRKNLNYHRSVILQNKAGIDLHRFKPSGLNFLLEASSLTALPRYKTIGLGLMRRNFWFGALCYNILDIRSHWRAKWHNRNQEVNDI